MQHTCVCVFMCVCMCVYIYIYIYICIYIYIYRCTHTHTPEDASPTRLVSCCTTARLFRLACLRSRLALSLKAVACAGGSGSTPRTISLEPLTPCPEPDGLKLKPFALSTLSPIACTLHNPTLPKQTEQSPKYHKPETLPPLIFRRRFS